MNQSHQVGHTSPATVEFPIPGIRTFHSYFDLRPAPDFLRERRRMGTALVLSLLIHALLLSLSFGSQGFGLPGLDLPWRERRFEAYDLRVILVPAQVTTPTPTPMPMPMPAMMEPSTDLTPTGVVKPEPITASEAMDVMVPSPTKGPRGVVSPPVPAPAVIALERSDTATLVVPIVPVVSVPVTAALPSIASTAVEIPAHRVGGEATQKPTELGVQERTLELAKLDRAKQDAQQQADQMEAARMDAERQEAARQAVARKDATRQEAERLEAAKQAAVRQEVERVEAAQMEAERQEAARQVVARKDATRQEAERLEAAKQAAVRQEVERAEATRMDAERQEAARQVLARKEATRQEAERLEAARQATVRQEVERLEAAQMDAARKEAARQETARQERAQQVAARAEQEAKREAVLRAIGKQLDEEAAKRDAASLAAHPSSTLAPSSSSARRGRLFGRTDPNTELILYAEAWSRKIELNMTFDMVREAAKQRHTNPLVTVALRSDGSVESVTFVLSSGVAEIDEAIRRIVQSQVPYSPFPPGLAREYDVIEIRRSWYFDMAVRLF